MNNTFNDTLPKSVRIPKSHKGVKIDADAVRAELSRWVGWYRKETAETKSPKEQHSEAEAIAKKLLELSESFANPQGMHLDLRALVKENMRHLGIAIPEFGRLAACVRNAGEQLSPVRTGRRNNEARDNAIRAVFGSLRKHSTPTMGITEARSLAAQLVQEGTEVTCPTDPKELRKIIGGN